VRTRAPRSVLLSSVFVASTWLALASGTSIEVALAAAPDCARSETGNVALTDLRTGSYQGEQGGLYPGGTNRPPAAYEKAGRLAGQSVVSLNSDGAPDPLGRIGFLAIGMSNAAFEFLGFMHQEQADPTVRPALAMVDGAQPGEAADAWVKPDSQVWPVADQRLKADGITPLQVEVIWLKQADAFPKSDFETYAHGLADELTGTIHSAASRYPNLKQVFISPRTYGGYGPGGPNPEPYAYETGFAVKFVVAQSVARPAVKPWVGWGPYLWTDGIAGRSDGVKWECSDVSDGTHPSETGVAKVSAMMLALFGQSEFTPWFRPPQQSAPSPTPSDGSLVPQSVGPAGLLASNPWLMPAAIGALVGAGLVIAGWIVVRRFF
jgi:hypothetical protein